MIKQYYEYQELNFSITGFVDFCTAVNSLGFAVDANDIAEIQGYINQKNAEVKKHIHNFLITRKIE